MTKLCLVRHGQTDWNQEGRWQGHADPPLNATGVAQAQLVASRLAESHFEAIYSSDLKRARATAEQIAEKLNITVKINSCLRELNMGAWEGNFLTEIPSLYPESWIERQTDPVGSHPPGGESIKELSQRVMAAFTVICAENPPDADVLVVAHGLSLAVFICQAKGRPLVEAFDRIPPNATPLYLDWKPEENYQIPATCQNP